MNHTNAPPLTLGQCASLACLWEVTAAKPGNVHRGADFEDLTFADFAASAVAIGPVIDRAAEWSVGKLALTCVEATRRVAATNTNLGIVLLLAPLARVPKAESCLRGVADILRSLDAQDAADVYAAIRLANPGGLGDAPEADVRDEAPTSLLYAMTLGAERDLVARQYANGFQQVFALADEIEALHANGESLGVAIVSAFVKSLSQTPDTLIARKCGFEVAERARIKAAQAMDARRMGDEAFWGGVADLDFWLRADGRRRNPGATADLIAAALFVLLREGRVAFPVRF